METWCSTKAAEKSSEASPFSAETLPVKKSGNIYAGQTRIYIGCPPEKLRSYHELGTRLKATREETDELERQLDYLRSKNGAKEEIMTLERGIGARLEALKEQAARLKALKESIKAPDGITVTVKDRIYPGAVLSFGLEEYPLGDKGLERAVLQRKGGRTVMHGYTPAKET